MGDYRTAMGAHDRRVCIDCTGRVLEYTRRAQAEGRQSPLDDSHVKWSQACDALGLDRAGLYRSEYEKRLWIAIAAGLGAVR